MRLDLEQKQNLKLSPTTVQFLQLLPLSDQELDALIEREALENPVLDMDLISRRLSVSEAVRRADWLKQQAARPYYQESQNEESAFPIEQDVSKQEPSLSDYLLMQLAASSIPERLSRAARYLIGCVDDHGYLSEKPEDIAKLFHLSCADAEKCFEVLRSFSPPGICASDLRHCLQAQLSPGDSLAFEIIENHLDDLASGHYSSIAKALSVSASAVRNAERRISALSPRPAEGFSGSCETQYLFPDVIVECTPDQELSVTLYRPHIPYLRINSEYLDMFQNTDDVNVHEYLSNKISSAEQLFRAVSIREESILSCAKIITEIQREYFLNQSNSLKPLSLADLAGRMEVSPATVSRTIKNKYIQCCHGVLPMKQFLSRELSSNTGSSVSTNYIQSELLSLIEAEDKSSPLSDQQLCSILNGQGIHVSRRVIAKYRDQLGIPGTYKRRTG